MGWSFAQTHRDNPAIAKVSKERSREKKASRLPLFRLQKHRKRVVVQERTATLCGFRLIVLQLTCRWRPTIPRSIAGSKTAHYNTLDSTFATASPGPIWQSHIVLACSLNQCGCQSARSQFSRQHGSSGLPDQLNERLSLSTAIWADHITQNARYGLTGMLEAIR